MAWPGGAACSVESKAPKHIVMRQLPHAAVVSQHSSCNNFGCSTLTHYRPDTGCVRALVPGLPGRSMWPRSRPGSCSSCGRGRCTPRTPSWQQQRPATASRWVFQHAHDTPAVVCDHRCSPMCTYCFVHWAGVVCCAQDVHTLQPVLMAGGGELPCLQCT